jgi:hypothetical protein
MRVGLAILIAVVQLVGPWLCCCGPARVVAAFARSKTETDPTPPAKPHCPLCAQSEPKPAPTPEKKPPPTDRCPCGGAEFVALPVTLWKSDDVPTAGGPVWEPASFTPLYSFRVESVVLSGDEGLRELPHLTTADRLYAHHVLRC